jgi:acyl-CoA dehydrogenase
MNFDFSDELKLLREQARRFLSERCSSPTVRRILEGAEPYRRAGAALVRCT